MEQRMVNIQLKTSRKKLLRNNASKFLFFAWTLDRLVQYKAYQGAERINIGYIDSSIFRTNLIEETKESKEDVNYWLQEMIFIGLIKYEPDNVRDIELVHLTQKGLDAYKAQTYHIIAANLLEAQASRNLARWAIWLAAISVIITLMPILIDIFKKIIKYRCA